MKEPLQLKDFIENSTKYKSSLISDAVPKKNFKLASPPKVPWEVWEWSQGGLCEFILSSQKLQTQNRSLKKWMGEFSTRNSSRKILKKKVLRMMIIFV